MKKFAVVCVLFVLVTFSQNAFAYPVTLTDFEGRPAEALIEITDDGTNQITFDVFLVNTIADIQGVFFNFSGALSNFDIQGADVTGWDASGNVTDVGKGVNMKGTGETFDVGVAIGTPGIGADDIAATSFTIFNDTQLDLGDVFGMRLTSVGPDRQQSRKLLGGPASLSPPPVPPSAVPEPSTMLLLGVGLCGLVVLGRKKLQK